MISTQSTQETVMKSDEQVDAKTVDAVSVEVTTAATSLVPCFRAPLNEEAMKSLTAYPEEDVIDGCTAAAHIAYACSEAAFIYPITPSSAMAEVYEVWTFQGRKNIFGQSCVVRQLQSEAGAAGAVHGSLSVGVVTTTFTASQGLLLMIPPMYKISGELIPCVFHVSARAIAGQALSIFGDHSDVMAVRQCGWALLASASVQESQDLALIAHMATLMTRVPFVHFFDGFRTSHELQKIKMIDYAVVRDLINFDKIELFRNRGLNPSHPCTKGTAQGPEVFFQNVEVSNKYYLTVPDAVEEAMELFSQAIGRKYNLFEYYGNENAEDVMIIMGAGGPVIQETIDHAEESSVAPFGVISVKLYRPWKLSSFIEAIPKNCKRICVLDRTKEPGALGEPLFLDVAASLQSAGYSHIKVIGGRYGLGSKDFSPAMVMGLLDHMRQEEPRHGFVVGIEDDITNLSVPYKQYNSISTVPKGTTECMFWGMGSDGTVGANKNVIKIIGVNTPLQVQGYFAYSAHKAGGITISHLRFGPHKIRSQYLVSEANYVAVHRAQYIDKYDVGVNLKKNGIFVLNTSMRGEELENAMPARLKKIIAEREVRMFLIDANKVAADNGMGRRINNVLMTSFFKLSGVLPFEDAIRLFKNAIQKTYSKKGKHVVEANWRCVDAAFESTEEYLYNREEWAVAEKSPRSKRWAVTGAISEVPTFVQGVMLALERMEGDDLPTSAFSEFAGGIIPPGTAGFEKRAIALNVPVVDMDKCTQCNHCAFVCPHAAIRPFLIDDEEAENAPETFIMKKCKAPQSLAAYQYRIQVSPYDCTGCELCYLACPDDALKMIELETAEKFEDPNWDFAIKLKDRSELVPADQRNTLKGSQFYTPLVEFSGACEGCGETPYVKLLTQLFGERLVIANATGCSSIWGASYPANSYTINQKGFGPAWSNSLFEDNAEYGYGMVIALTHRRERFRQTVEEAMSNPEVTKAMSTELRSYMSEWLLNWTNSATCQKIYEKAVPLLLAEGGKHIQIRSILTEKDMLQRISLWIVGGDGWGNDIGYGGLDHVFASGADVNILLLDTEGYSNTGGQKSKGTPAGAVHKFATGGVLRNKKDLGALCMEYEDVYVASCASSANMSQTVRAFVEAEQYHGTSLIIAYSPCIEHQYIKPFNLQLEHCKLAVDCGYWPLYRFNPALCEKGENPFQLDSKKLKADIVELLKKENRFGTLRRSNPVLAQELEAKLREWIMMRFQKMSRKAAGFVSTTEGTGANGKAVEWNVLYGTDTGNTEEVAKRMVTMLKDREITCAINQLDEVSLEDLSNMKNVLLLCSTCGQGEMPEMAKEIYHEMEKETNKTLLKDLRFAVMGMGDSNYVFFNKSATDFDEALHSLGAQRILPCGMGDDQAEDGYETALGEWTGNFLVETKMPEPKNVSTTPGETSYKVEMLTEEQASSVKVEKCMHFGTTEIKLIENTRMTPENYDVNVRHLEFDLSGSNLKYSRGDSLAIWPTNSDDEVNSFCDYYKFNPDQMIKVSFKEPVEMPQKYASIFKNAMTLRQLFTECLDLFAKPGRAFYQVLYKYCTNEEEKETAKNILSNKPLLQKMMMEECVTYFDVLKKFPSSKTSITVEHLIEMIPIIKVRYYSIASSQKLLGQDRLQLCVGIVEWDTATGAHRFGRCTGFLARNGDVSKEKPLSLCACIKPTAFNLPPNDLAPIVVAGMGTGLAPFRAFIQHKEWLVKQAKSTGPLTVYFGCRYRSKDYLYGDELQNYEKQQIINDLKCAFSRDQKEKFYIQHAILSDAPLFYKRMVTEDGFFYLCGSAKQVPIDIRNAVRQVLVSQGAMSEQTAEQTITQWQIKGKYNVEAW